MSKPARPKKFMNARWRTPIEYASQRKSKLPAKKSSVSRSSGGGGPFSNVRSAIRCASFSPGGVTAAAPRAWAGGLARGGERPRLVARREGGVPCSGSKQRCLNQTKVPFSCRSGRCMCPQCDSQMARRSSSGSCPLSRCCTRPPQRASAHRDARARRGVRETRGRARTAPHSPASCVAHRMWSMPPRRSQNGQRARTYRTARSACATPGPPFSVIPARSAAPRRARGGRRQTRRRRDVRAGAARAVLQRRDVEQVRFPRVQRAVWAFQQLLQHVDVRAVDACARAPASPRSADVVRSCQSGLC